MYTVKARTPLRWLSGKTNLCDTCTVEVEDVKNTLIPALSTDAEEC